VAYAALAMIVATRALDGSDRSLLTLAQLPHAGWLDFAANLTTIPGQLEVTGTLAVGMALARLRHRRHDWWEPLGLVVVTMIEVATKVVVPQPPPPPELSRSMPLLAFLSPPLGHSFPSGHVARVAYLGGVLSVIPLWLRVGLIAGMVATRVYLAEHWPTDTLGGLLLGLGGILLVWAIATRMKRGRPGDAEGAR